MKVRYPLYLQTITFLLLHLALVCLILVALFNSTFGMGWDALLSSPLGDRVDSISFMIHEQGRNRPLAAWNQMLSEFGSFYGVKFYVFNRRGEQLAGDPVQLPDSVLQRTTRRRGRSGQPASADVAPPTQTELSSATSGAVREHLMRGRFVIRTGEPRLFWVGTRIMLPGTDTDQSASRSGPTPPFSSGTLIATTPNLWQSRLFFDLPTVASAVGGVYLISILLWWPFVYSITKAMGDVTTATERIAKGQFDARVKVGRADEIGRLAVAVNTMAEQLESYVDGQRRFLGDTAHELCSPVARLQVALELLDGSTGAEEQEKVINDLREDVTEMSALINELLAFSKAGLKGKEINLMPVDLSALLRQVLVKTVAESIVKSDVQPSIFVLGDQLLLERAFGNLVRNAIRYAAEDGPITIKSFTENDSCCISICDSGPGVPAAAVNRLGQPFYRPEPSRSRESGGVGLGLAIVKACIETCGGKLRIANRQPRGLQVDVELSITAAPVQEPPSKVAAT